MTRYMLFCSLLVDFPTYCYKQCKQVTQKIVFFVLLFAEGAKYNLPVSEEGIIIMEKCTMAAHDKLGQHMLPFKYISSVESKT